MEDRAHTVNNRTPHGEPLLPLSSILYPISSAPIGLLAGSGRFPIVFAEKARSLGIRVVCVGIRYEASPQLAGLVDRFYWTGVARLGRMIRCFKREKVQRLVMAGKITKAGMDSPWRWLSLLPDWRNPPFVDHRPRRK